MIDTYIVPVQPGTGQAKRPLKRWQRENYIDDLDQLNICYCEALTDHLAGKPHGRPGMRKLSAEIERVIGILEADDALKARTREGAA